MLRLTVSQSVCRGVKFTLELVICAILKRKMCTEPWFAQSETVKSELTNDYMSLQFQRSNDFRADSHYGTIRHCTQFAKKCR
jgi:hypothetical protein